MSFAVDLYMVRVSDPKIQNQPPVSYVLLRKLFSQVHIFFSWRNYFGENFRLFDFVRVSCMVRVSVKNMNTLKTSEELSDEVFSRVFV